MDSVRFHQLLYVIVYLYYCFIPASSLFVILISTYCKDGTNGTDIYETKFTDKTKPAFVDLWFSEIFVLF